MLKDQFFGRISQYLIPFLNTSIKAVANLMHHLAYHHWSKFQTKLTTFLGVPGPPVKWGQDLPPFFSKIALCRECFPGNLLLCCFPKHAKLFLARTLPESCRGL